MTDAGPASDGELDASRNDERELVARLKAFDEAAIRQVYGVYSDGLYRYALYQLADRAAAEDVVAEVFLRMLNTIERYEYRGCRSRHSSFALRAI